MKKIYPLLFCLIMLSIPLFVNATSVVTVSVTANLSFNRFEHANISGLLSQDGSPVTNGLVAVQMTYPNYNILTLRTVNTGSNPQNQIANIQSVYLSDLSGVQLNSASRGGLAYFKASVTNNDQQAKTILIAISVYDNYNSPIGFASSSATVQARDSREVILSVPIPSAAAQGVARVFAGAYSDLPSHGGVPYCAESSSTFAIDIQQGSAPADTQSGSQGNYALPLTIPINAAIGTYNIQASSVNNGLTAFASRTFTVSQSGDFNGDGKVDVTDITAFVIAYINYWGGYNFNPIADFDHNGAINVNDISQFVYAYIQYWSWN